MVLARLFSYVSEEQVAHNYKSALFELSRKFGIEPALVVVRDRNGSSALRNGGQGQAADTETQARQHHCKAYCRRVLVGQS